MGFGARCALIATNCHFFLDGVSIGCNNPSLTTGCRNIVIGQQNLLNSTSARGNVAIGYGALTWQTGNGAFSIAIGYVAGYNNNGTSNIYIGERAGYGVTSCLTGLYNVVIGAYAGGCLVCNSCMNTFIGYCAGFTAGSGIVTGNTLIGLYCSVCLTTGCSNTIIGGTTSVNFASATRNLIIAAGCTVTTNCPCIEIFANTTGFGLGNTAPAAALHVTGCVAASLDITAYYSDRRLKENIIIIDCAIDKIKKLSGVTYNVNDLGKKFGFENTNIQYGLLADEVEQVIPEAVTLAPFDVDENKKSITGENYKTVKYDRVIPLLIQAIKEIDSKVDNLAFKLKGSCDGIYD